MAGREASKMKLSKGILEMKFMKRTKEKVEKQLYQEEGEEYFGSQLTTRMKKESGRFIVEPSFSFCEQLRDGRVSYQGMNPEVERLMELEQSGNVEKVQPKREEDVTNEQMAKRLKSSDVTTMENKFKTKRQRSQDFCRDKISKSQDFHRDKSSESQTTRTRKRKFLKPKD